jgi:hypothetical protein
LKLTLFARKSVAKRLVLFARLFYFGDDFGEQSSTKTAERGDGRPDDLRDADFCAGGRYFQFASICSGAASIQENEQSSGYENRYGWNRTKRGDPDTCSACCVFGAESN